MHKSTKGGNANKKGRFLETLVAFLHEVVGDNVERNALLPTSDGTGRTREIDVLLKVASEELAGCPIHIPIECKNYRERIGVEHVDAFVGKLKDIGIDANLGIYVAASGYTCGAVKRAEAAGIKTLVADGLTRDRLALEVERVLHSLVFWIAQWKDTSYFPFIPTSDGPDGSIVADLPAGAAWETGCLDTIWQLWLEGKIPCVIGEHCITVRMKENKLAVCTVEVSAQGALLPGRVKTAALRNAKNDKTEKQYMDVDFQWDGSRIVLKRYGDDAELEHDTRRGTARLALRAPRIIGPKMYWPPTVQTANRVAQLLASNQPVSFDRVEGANLLKAWVVPESARVNR